MVRNQPNKLHNTWSKVGAVFARCYQSKQRIKMATDFHSLQRNFLGTLPLGFEGVKTLAMQKLKIRRLLLLLTSPFSEPEKQEVSYFTFVGVY